MDWGDDFQLAKENVRAGWIALAFPFNITFQAVESTLTQAHFEATEQANPR